MSKDRTYASDVETKGDAEELAKGRSVDAEKAKPKSGTEQDEEDRAAAQANAAGQTGQT